MKLFKRLIIITFIIWGETIFSLEEGTYIASFNTLHLGQKDKNISLLKELFMPFDLIALQEVMDEGGLKEVVSELGVNKWDYHISAKRVGSGSYKEYFAFVWNRETTSLIKSLGFYPDYENRFSRPPYGAYFKVEEMDVVVVNVHSVYGDSINERRLEALAMSDVYNYFQNLISKEKDVVIMGDFNLSARDEAFDPLLSHPDLIAYGINPGKKTTLGKNKLSSSYDNIFYPRRYFNEYTRKSGRVNYPISDYDKNKRGISDHLLVFIQVDASEDDD